MSNNIHFMAFPLSNRLHRNAEDFIDHCMCSERSSERNHVLLLGVLEKFVYECLCMYFVEPCIQAGLSPTSRRIVDSTVTAIFKTVSFALGKIIYKLDRYQMKA